MGQMPGRAAATDGGRSNQCLTSRPEWMIRSELHFGCTISFGARRGGCWYHSPRHLSHPSLHGPCAPPPRPKDLLWHGARDQHAPVQAANSRVSSTLGAISNFFAGEEEKKRSRLGAPKMSAEDHATCAGTTLGTSSSLPHNTRMYKSPLWLRRCEHDSPHCVISNLSVPVCPPARNVALKIDYAVVKTTCAQRHDVGRVGH